MNEASRRSRYYIPRDVFCAESGLTLDCMVRLESVRLLVPDKDEMFRPKLVYWRRKHAYLLKHDWELNEIKRWASERWNTSNPKRWPPDRMDCVNPDS